MAKTWATKCCSGTYKNNYQLCCGIKDIQTMIDPFGSGQKETELSGYKPMTLTQTKRRFHKALSRISPPPTDYPATGYIASREANSILVSGSVRKARGSVIILIKKIE
ncbi:hypothetical protein [Parabacteroides distasonis]|uniref:hypothetical protein n=1 Tax=Parabacteroides distasonis TaxID=823 RepID=UPI001E590063